MCSLHARRFPPGRYSLWADKNTWVWLSWEHLLLLTNPTVIEHNTPDIILIGSKSDDNFIAILQDYGTLESDWSAYIDQVYVIPAEAAGYTMQIRPHRIFCCKRMPSHTVSQTTGWIGWRNWSCLRHFICCALWKWLKECIWFHAEAGTEDRRSEFQLMECCNLFGKFCNGPHHQ